jgi:hypothetical protein
MEGDLQRVQMITQLISRYLVSRAAQMITQLNSQYLVQPTQTFDCTRIPFYVVRPHGLDYTIWVPVAQKSPFLVSLAMVHADKEPFFRFCTSQIVNSQVLQLETG